MENKNTKEKNEAASIAEGEAAVRNKKGFGLDDVRGAVSKDETVVNTGDNSSVLGNIILWVFCVLLFISGVFVMIITSYTIIGLIFGLVMVIAAVVLPFTVSGNWMKTKVE